jgi:hypothetical protein
MGSGYKNPRKGESAWSYGSMAQGGLTLFLVCGVVGSLLAFIMLGTGVWTPNSGINSEVHANSAALARIQSCINVTNGTDVTVSCTTTVEEDANFQSGFCSGESCVPSKKRSPQLSNVFQIGIESIFGAPTSAVDIDSDLLAAINLTVTNNATIGTLNVTTLEALFIQVSTLHATAMVIVDLIVEFMSITAAYIGDLFVTGNFYMDVNGTTINVTALIPVWNITAPRSAMRRTVTDFIPFNNSGFNSTIIQFNDLNEPFFYGANYDPWGIFDLSTPDYITMNQPAFISVQLLMYFASNFSNTQAMCSIYLNSTYQVILDPIPPFAIAASNLINVTGTPQGDFFPYVGLITTSASGYALAGAQITVRCLCPQGEVFAFTPSSSISVSTIAIEPPNNPTEAGIIVPAWPFSP